MRSATTDADKLTEALGDWRQGDAIIDDGLYFLHLADLRQPLTAAAREAANDGSSDGASDDAAIPSAVAGFVILTQTCDIVRHCATRPYIEVAPLVPVSEGVFVEVKRARTPRFAYVPATAQHRLVADLDQVMTIEKSLLLRWQRIAGCISDEQRRDFARALARKRQRFAFPNEFDKGCQRFQERLRSKHNKNSPEGVILRTVSEIRISATPHWGHNSTTLSFWFVVESADCVEPEVWAKQIESWLALIELPAEYQFDDPKYNIRTLDDMTAREYLHSVLLDLDDLSGISS